MNSLKLFLFAAIFAVCGAGFAVAHEHKGHALMAGDLKLDHAIIPATIKVAPVAAGYLTITNTGREADRLVGVSAGFSEKQQIHTMVMVEGVMKMRQLEEGIIIPAGETVALQKGGDHLMFMKLTEQMKEGEVREAVLTFEKAGKVTVRFEVIDPATLEGGETEHGSEHDHGDHSGHDMSHGEKAVKEEDL